nr:tail tubular protein A [uncultured Mediterranean phage uvMED]
MGLKQQEKAQGRTTLLDAVNVCLENIGEQPVDNLDNEQIQDARIAERTILEIHKEGQTKGWSWNTEYAYPFQRNATTSEIEVPGNVVQFSVNRYQYNGRYQLRGTKVYDLIERSFLFPTTKTEIKADVIWLLAWDSVPEAYNRWVTIRAARIFSDRTLGSEALFKYTAKDEADAQAQLERVELEQENPNMLSGPYAFPTYQPNSGLMNRRVANGYSIF